MNLRYATAGAAGALASLVCAASAGAHLAPMPNICNGDPNCITKGGGGDTTVSPTLVRVGHVLTIKLESRDDAYGGVASWTIGTRAMPGATPPSLKLLGCKGRTIHKPVNSPADIATGLAGSAICRYRVLSSGRGWQAAVANFSVRYGGLASYSEAAWRVVPKGSYIEGYVRGLPRHKGEAGTPLTGVRVTARGKSSDSTTTDNQGYYVLQVAKPGTYEVFPKRRAMDNDLHPVPKFTPDSRNVSVDSNRVSDVNFRLHRADDIKISFADASGKKVSGIPADGVSAATVLVQAVDANEQPLSDANGVSELQVVVDGARLSSKAILCGPSNTRIWPGYSVGGSWSPAVDDHEDPTRPDAHGLLTMTLYAGTEAGSVEIAARVPDAAKDDPGRSATLVLEPVKGGSLAETAAFARTNYTSGYPNPQPLDSSSESSWWFSDLYYLADAKSHGYWKGWEYLPLATTSAPQRYGIFFYRNGNTGEGGVLETTNAGLRPLESGGALPSVGAWANGQSYAVQQLSSGYPGDGLFYNGWPYERGPADPCIRRGPR